MLLNCSDYLSFDIFIKNDSGNRSMMTSVAAVVYLFSRFLEQAVYFFIKSGF